MSKTAGMFHIMGTYLSLPDDVICQATVNFMIRHAKKFDQLFESTLKSMGATYPAYAAMFAHSTMLAKPDLLCLYAMS